MKTVSIAEVSRLVWLGFYAAIEKDLVEYQVYQTTTRIRYLLPGLKNHGVISENKFRMALDELVHSGQFEVTRDEDEFDGDDRLWKLSRVGIQTAERQFEDPHVRDEAFALLDESQENSAANFSEAQPDNWEPIPLDLDSEQTQAAIKSIEEVRDEFRKENGFASQEPEKKRALLSALDQGVAAFKAKVLTRLTLETLIIAPLSAISSIFGKAALGELAKMAIAAIRTAIGI